MFETPVVLIHVLQPYKDEETLLQTQFRTLIGKSLFHTVAFPSGVGREVSLFSIPPLPPSLRCL